MSRADPDWQRSLLPGTTTPRASASDAAPSARRGAASAWGSAIKDEAAPAPGSGRAAPPSRRGRAAAAAAAATEPEPPGPDAADGRPHRRAAAPPPPPPAPAAIHGRPPAPAGAGRRWRPSRSWRSWSSSPRSGSAATRPRRRRRRRSGRRSRSRSRRATAATRSPPSPRRRACEGDYMKATESFKGFDPLDKYGAEDAENLEGFLFPATYELFKNAQGRGPGRKAARGLRAEHRRGRPLLREVEEPDRLRRGHDRLDDRARGAGARGARATSSSVIYNRLAAGMPLGIDATIRFEDSNYDEQLLESRLAEDTPYNTRIEHRPAARARSATPGWTRSRPRPTRPRPTTSSSSSSPAPAASTSSPRPRRSSSQAEAEYQAALQAEGGSPTEC